MAHREHAPETPATSFLRQNHVSFTEHLYDYVEHGGTSESARQLGVDEHAVVKTLVMQDEARGMRRGGLVAMLRQWMTFATLPPR
jgi:prolyl-tRNA editing enzyme YbaK/EbsC (Cys-tRNA(Pro) deacylase)